MYNRDTFKCILNSMPKDVPIKKFREKLAEYADRIEAGESFRIIRRSKPSFVVMHIDDDVDSEGKWETVVDFTDGGKKKGMPADNLLKLLKKINREDG